MTDSNIDSISIRAKCNICGVRMRLSRGLAMGASSQGPTMEADTDGLGILVPVIAEDEEPDKEWGFILTRTVIGGT